MKLGKNEKTILKLTVFACLLSIVSESAAAEVLTRVSKDFYTDDTFTLNDKVGIVNVNDDDRIIIDYNNDFIVIMNNTCNRVVNDQFCLNDVEYDPSVDKKKAKLVIYYIGPDITITRNANKTTPLVGEGIKMTTKLKNTGNITADNVTYIDLFPPEMEVVDVIKGFADIQKVSMWSNDSGKWQNMTRVFWQGDIGRGEEITIYYILKPKSNIDGKFMARAIYNDGLNVVEEISPAIAIKTSSFFKISKKFAALDYTVDAGSTTLVGGESKGELQVGEKLLFITEIKNEIPQNETINVTYIDFYIPGGMVYEGTELFRVYTNSSNSNRSYMTGVHTLKKVANDTYRWSGLLGPDDMAFALKLKGTKKGTKRVAVNAHLVQFAKKKEPYYVPLSEEDYSAYEEIEVKIDVPTIESNFKSGQTFESGQRAYLTIYAQNENDYVNFTDIKVIINSPWLGENMTFSRIKKTQYIDFFDGDVSMPFVSSPTTYKIYVNASYKTEYGEVYSSKLERSVSVKPHVPLQISHTASPAFGSSPDRIVIENGESDVDVKITNTGNIKIEHINFTEVIDPGLSNDGNLTRVVNVDKGIVMDVLEYTIDPPDAAETKEYKIKTYIDYNSVNETYHTIKETVIEVKPKKMSISAKKTSQLDITSLGVPFYIDYEIENTAGEEIQNVTILFPLSENFEIVGSRYYTIASMAKDEIMPVMGKEMLIPKTNSSSVKIEKTSVVFHDKYGNEFDSNTTAITLEIIYKPLQAPMLNVVRNISKTELNEGEKLTVTTTVKNIGVKAAAVSIDDIGKSWEMQLEPGKEKAFSYEYGEERSGTITLEPAMASYKYEGLMHYAASNKNEIAVKEAVAEEEKKEQAPVVQQQTIQKIEEQISERTGIAKKYLKYLYLAVFIVITCIIIFSVIRAKPKAKRFEFMEK